MDCETHSVASRLKELFSWQVQHYSSRRRRGESGAGTGTPKLRFRNGGACGGCCLSARLVLALMCTGTVPVAAVRSLIRSFRARQKY